MVTTQAQVINKILQTKDFSIVTKNHLNEDYFFDYPAEFSFIKSHYDEYGSVPDMETFAGTFPDFDVFNVAEPESYLVDSLLKDRRDAYIGINFNKIKQLIVSGKSDEAKEAFVNSASNIPTIKRNKCIDLFENSDRYDAYFKKATSKKQFISTGFKELDKIIGGIDPDEENMVVAARTGQGKSWFIIIAAVAAVKQSKKVGIYSGEMSANKVGFRFDTFLAHIDNKAITRGNLAADGVYKKYFEQLHSKDSKFASYGHALVLTPNELGHPATVDDLKDFIEDNKLDILFVDQYSLLEDTSHAKSVWEKVGNISKAIKNLQVMERIPIVSVSQMNREKNEDGSQDTTQLGLSDRIGQDATTVIMLDRGKKEINTEMTDEAIKTSNVADKYRKVIDSNGDLTDTEWPDQLIVNVVKARDGGDGAKLIYGIDFNTGKYQNTFNSSINAKDEESMFAAGNFNQFDDFAALQTDTPVNDAAISAVETSQAENNNDLVDSVNPDIFNIN